MSKRMYIKTGIRRLHFTDSPHAIPAPLGEWVMGSYRDGWKKVIQRENGWFDESGRAAGDPSLWEAIE